MQGKINEKWKHTVLCIKKKFFYRRPKQNKKTVLDIIRNETKIMKYIAPLESFAVIQSQRFLKYSTLQNLYTTIFERFQQKPTDGTPIS